jgi:lipopolysaccharide biosynthesis regulator YciM
MSTIKIKISFILLIILLSIIGIFYLQSYDMKIQININNYLITTKLTVMLLIMLICWMSFSLITGIISFPFQLITRLNSNIRLKKEKNILKNMIEASQFILIGESDKACKMIQPILDQNKDLPVEIEEYLRFLFVNLDLNFNTKLHYTKKLFDHSNQFKFFVAKELSRIALQENAYHYSLEFALIAYEIDSSNAELLELLIEIYATMESWDKMVSTINLLNKIDKVKCNSIREKISNYYLKSAKHFIGLGELNNSVFYLLKCLEYKPDSFKCIELIANIHLENKELNLQKIIETAFALSPSFDLFLIYYKSYKSYLLTSEIYNNLISTMDINKHRSLAISIAYFFNMKAELDKLVLPLI